MCVCGGGSVGGTRSSLPPATTGGGGGKVGGQSLGGVGRMAASVSMECSPTVRTKKGLGEWRLPVAQALPIKHLLKNLSISVFGYFLKELCISLRI